MLETKYFKCIHTQTSRLPHFWVKTNLVQRKRIFDAWKLYMVFQFTVSKYIRMCSCQELYYFVMEYEIRTMFWVLWNKQKMVRYIHIGWNNRMSVHSDSSTHRCQNLSPQSALMSIIMSGICFCRNIFTIEMLMVLNFHNALHQQEFVRGFFFSFSQYNECITERRTKNKICCCKHFLKYRCYLATSTSLFFWPVFFNRSFCS